MASAAGSLKLLFIHHLLLLPLFVGLFVLIPCFVMQDFLSFRNESLFLYFYCLFGAMWLLLSLPHGAWVGLQCVIVAFSGHTHLSFSRGYLGDSSFQASRL